MDGRPKILRCEIRSDYTGPDYPLQAPKARLPFRAYEGTRGAYETRAETYSVLLLSF
jgi:hypothetical protein